ncbi:hypothetical protein EJ05DRAFT_482439 [Pseudovirgaria hyperparasitica]|uniref:Uncharacterized protein n=1 Tax=Pseudovirgaria hyperparasitica TaxID=470096 RepID=A0A6A6WFH6_9PEZI|nr:uncharacterized protein EJ05DRAFT_482439 [Pseudovirgaria hyperparasitica]KAF2761572.1 hypothetical protein EJ05DRAFT_482439 [Pseudovirgaria hyperparasitica]
MAKRKANTSKGADRAPKRARIADTPEIFEDSIIEKSAEEKWKSAKSEWKVERRRLAAKARKPKTGSVDPPPQTANPDTSSCDPTTESGSQTQAAVDSPMQNKTYDGHSADDSTVPLHSEKLDELDERLWSLHETAHKATHEGLIQLISSVKQMGEIIRARDAELALQSEKIEELEAELADFRAKKARRVHFEPPVSDASEGDEDADGEEGEEDDGSSDGASEAS